MVPLTLDMSPSSGASFIRKFNEKTYDYLGNRIRDPRCGLCVVRVLLLRQRRLPQAGIRSHHVLFDRAEVSHGSQGLPG